MQQRLREVLVTCPWRVPIDKLGFPLIDLRSQSVRAEALILARFGATLYAVLQA